IARRACRRRDRPHQALLQSRRAGARRSVSRDLPRRAPCGLLQVAGRSGLSGRSPTPHESLPVGRALRRVLLPVLLRALLVAWLSSIPRSSPFLWGDYASGASVKRPTSSNVAAVAAREIHEVSVSRPAAARASRVASDKGPKRDIRSISSDSRAPSLRPRASP